jgi:hypothetical protein
MKTLTLTFALISIFAISVFGQDKDSLAYRKLDFEIKSLNEFFELQFDYQDADTICFILWYKDSPDAGNFFKFNLKTNGHIVENDGKTEELRYKNLGDFIDTWNDLYLIELNYHLRVSRAYIRKKY